MKVSLFLWLFFLGAHTVSAQYSPTPKLQILYEKGDYVGCIEKSQLILADEQGELYPYFWQMRSYIAIHFLKYHEKQKLAIEKALQIAQKIKKKDGRAYFEKTYPDVYVQLISESKIRAQDYCNIDFEKAESLYEKLKSISNDASIVFQQYQCHRSLQMADASQVLRNYIEWNYALFLNGDVKNSSAELCYVECLKNATDSVDLSGARTIFKKGMAVYPNSQLLSAQMLVSNQNLVSQLDFKTEVKALRNLQTFFKAIDSIKQSSSFLNNKTLEYYLANRMLSLAVDRTNQEAYKSVKQYLTGFDASLVLDSADHLFFDYLSRKEARGNVNLVFSYWTDIVKFYQKLSYVQAIKHIDLFIQSRHAWKLESQYLNYCLLAFKADKPAILQLKTELDQRIVKEIKTPAPSMKVEEVIEISDDSKLVDLQMQAELRPLQTLLDQKKFVEFARQIQQKLDLFPKNPKLLALKKQGIILDYKDQMQRVAKADELSFFSKLPMPENCQEGVINSEGFNFVINRMNYLRRLAGIVDTSVMNQSFSQACQVAALMMHANNALDHHPHNNWKCYKKEAALAAGNSNLSLGYGFVDALMGQMRDDGAGNYAVGHRRWILNPYNYTFGLGSTQNAMCLKVFDTERHPNFSAIKFKPTQYVAWPSADYFPLPLLPKRWSFSLENADFSSAQIVVSMNGIPLKVKQERQVQGYALNTIVWTVEHTFKKDIDYTVTISQLKLADGTIQTIVYTVSLLEIK